MNAAQLEQALKIQRTIDRLESERDQLLNGRNHVAAPRGRGRRVWTEEQKEKARQAALKRWANMPKSQRDKIAREARKRAKG